MTTVTLPSGAKANIGIPPFEVSKNLYQAILEEMKNVQMKLDDEVDFNFIKNLVCAGFSSKKIEECVWECMKKVTYEGAAGKFKVVKDTFEPVEARQDYIPLVIEVTMENIAPFMKSLSAQSSRIKDLMAIPGRA